MPNWTLPITLVCVVVGMLMAAQFKVQAIYREEAPSRRLEDLVVLINQEDRRKQDLGRQVEELQERLRSASNVSPAPGTDTPQWGPLLGPGVEVQIADSVKPLSKGENPNIAIVHNEDLLRIVNELRASGAEALAVNDERLVDTTEISCAGPTILVNHARMVPPFIIRAIGDADTMMAAMQLRGGVVVNLQSFGIQVNITRKPDVRVPTYLGGGAYQYARPVSTAKPAQSPAIPT